MRLRYALAAVFTVALSGSYARADGTSFYVNMTETSSTDLEVSVLFPDSPSDFSFDGTITSPAGDDWTIFQEQSYNNSTPVDSSWHDSGGYLHSTNLVAWLEPDSDPNNPTYNLLVFGYDPSGGIGEYIYAFSDMSVADLDNFNFYTNCFYGANEAYQPCPILSNGQSTDIDLYDHYATGPSLGTMDVTFNDTGDVASTAPEPGTMLLLGVGLLALVAGARQRVLA